MPDGFLRRGADSYDPGHGLERSLEDCFDVDRDHNYAREPLRYDAGGLAALSRQEMMSFVQDNPVRASSLGAKLL
jgi:hypothetical protein